MAGGATAGSGRSFRLDPETLPARFAPGLGVAGASFIIERERAIVRRQDAAGPALTLAVPLTAYRGVSVRMEAVGNAGDVCAFVELLHADASLTLPLAVSDDPYSVERDWKAWGRALNLPLLLIGQDGSIASPLSDNSAVIAIKATKPRRRHSFFAGRRPRFLTRRKVGRLERMVRLEGREIIART